MEGLQGDLVAGGSVLLLLLLFTRHWEHTGQWIINGVLKFCSDITKHQ